MYFPISIFVCSHPAHKTGFLQFFHVSYNTEGLIKTGTVLTFSDGTKYEAVIKGDINGDGVVDSKDILRLKNDLLSRSKLNGVYFAAADLYNDNKLDAKDMLKLQRGILEKEEISQL